MDADTKKKEPYLRESVPVNDMLPYEDLTQRRKGRKESLSLRLGVSILVVHHVSAQYSYLRESV